MVAAVDFDSDDDCRDSDVDEHSQAAMNHVLYDMRAYLSSRVPTLDNEDYKCPFCSSESSCRICRLFLVFNYFCVLCCGFLLFSNFISAFLYSWFFFPHRKESLVLFFGPRCSRERFLRGKRKTAVPWRALGSFPKVDAGQGIILCPSWE